MSQELLEHFHPDDWQECLRSFKKGITLRQIADMPLITMRQGNRLRNMVDSVFAHDFKPQIVFECDQQDLIYSLAKQSAGVGLLSPVVLYQNLNEIKQQGDTFYSFPLTDVPEIVLYLVYRSDLPLPRYIVDFVQTACLMFRNYSRTIDNHFS